MIHDILVHNNPDDNISRKYRIMKELNIIKKQLLRTMRIIKIDSSDEDTFRFSILYSLHYYNISRHPERISKVIPFENKYNFSRNTPKEFEMDNPNISLTFFDENERIIY